MTQRAAGCLTSLRIELDRIITSAATRTRETAQILAESANQNCPLSSCEWLYNASAAQFGQAAAREADVNDRTILIVGHNPGIAGLMCHWAGEDFAVTPATLAVFDVDVPLWNAVQLTSKPAPVLNALVRNGEIVQQR